MTQGFEEHFRSELVALCALFGRDRVGGALARVKEIHEYIEAKWQAYADQLAGGVVRHVLIAEAPPWSTEGTPQHLLDPASRVRTLMRALQQVFPGAHLGSSADALRVFAKHGFLLLDSVPFSMDYSSKRSSPRYDELIRLTTKSYLQAKIEAARLTWSADIRVAFAVDRNARSILRTTTRLAFGGRSYPISPELIAVNGAGYPDASRLRAIYGLHGDRTA